MNTATDQLRKEDEQKRNKHIFELQLEQFIKYYAPTDMEQRYQFEMHLISLVRQIYTDAQAPLLKHMELIYSHQSITFPVGSSK